METDEKPLKADGKTDNNFVHIDSCMEFFFRTENDDRYFNFEFNPNGTLLLGLGTGRHGRTLLDFDKSVFRVESVTGELWHLKFFVPFSFVESYVGKFTNRFFGNFYKCGEETVHPHLACWNEIKFAQPDFHRPEWFGEFIFAGV